MEEPKGKSMNARKYALYGALFGLFFPVAGTLFQILFGDGAGGFVVRMGRAQSLPLMWIIDTAPFFLGMFASFAGKRQDEIIALEAEKRREFATTAGELFTGAQTLLSSVSSFSSMTSETAASVRETTATMQQLGQTAAQAALTAETVVGLAHATKLCSDEGLQSVELSISALLKLGEDVRGLAKNINALNSRTRDIFEIASVLNYLAERAERLTQSAGAQLERHAALAGFATVVEEMRHQAEDTKKAAAQVKGILGEMHKAMVATMAAAQSGVRRAEQGAQVATKTGENIKQLATALDDSSRAAKEIATVAQQQDHGIDQVLKAMNEIYLATEETMVSTQRVAYEAKVLNDVAHRLDAAVQGNGATIPPLATSLLPA
jgi:methyl-accepting chemotaxis protein